MCQIVAKTNSGFNSSFLFSDLHKFFSTRIVQKRMNCARFQQPTKHVTVKTPSENSLQLKTQQTADIIYAVTAKPHWSDERRAGAVQSRSNYHISDAFQDAAKYMDLL